MNEICRQLTAIPDQMDDLVAALISFGFSAFEPRRNFGFSFCETPDERQFHRRCVVELAKERLAQPSDIWAFGNEARRHWVSPFLEALRAERDRNNGTPFAELSKHYKGLDGLLRREFDPCRRRALRIEWEHREAWDAIISSMREAEQQALVDECEVHATGLGRSPHTFDGAGRYAFLSAVMERDAAPLGFKRDEWRWKPTYPVYSKAISPVWDLCWTIDDQIPFAGYPFHGRYEPTLQLRSRSSRGRSSAPRRAGESLTLNYQLVVQGFSRAYWTFQNLNELETLIISHLKLYSLMASKIETTITGVLGRSTG